MGSEWIIQYRGDLELRKSSSTECNETQGKDDYY